MAKKVKYDIGLGSKNFNLFVSGRKTPIASKSAEDLVTSGQVNAWAKRKYLQYIKNKMDKKRK